MRFFSFSRLIRVLVLLFVMWGVARATGLDRPPPGAFTIVVIPDTQGYRGARTKATPDNTDPLTNPVFANHIKWIRESIHDQNIVFVSHVGDIVDIDNEEQWRLAKENLDQLFGVVPFGLVVGNHDMKVNGDAALFQQCFPAERFKKYPWYGGSFEPAAPDQVPFGNNVNSYQLFSAGGLDFVFIHLECNAPDEVLDWAGQILTRYQNRRALISTHMDLGIRDKPTTPEGFISDPKGRMGWSKIHDARGNTPLQMWDKLYSKHTNLGFVFSGDQSRVTALRISQQADQGNVVHALLSDYLSAGPLRLYRFLPAQNKVQVITYDTTTRSLVDRMIYVPARPAHQFMLDYDMIPAATPAATVP